MNGGAFPERTSILLVDDRPANLLALEAMLERPEYHLVRASSGREALEVVRRHDFSVILLDVAMPEMDGFAVASAIKKMPESAGVPIIFVTAFSENVEWMSQAYEVGAVDFLQKPLDRQEVRAKVAVFADLHRKHIQIERQQMRLREELAASVRLRDEFLQVAGHELRTPLSALKLRLSGLQRRLRQPEEAEKHLRIAAQQCDRLGELAERLLDVSRLQSGKMELRLDRTDLAAIARQVVERMSEEAAKAGCQLLLRAPPSVSGVWDALRVEQVLCNLLSNAIKYGARKPVHVEVDASGPVARMVVRDEGIGIAAEAMHRIFGRFERALSVRNYGGLGLGLYLVAQIVDAHGGTVRAESDPEQGATFVVELPYDSSRMRRTMSSAGTNTG